VSDGRDGLNVVYCSPSDLHIFYNDLCAEWRRTEREYSASASALVNGTRRELFGGLLTEHITQHLARCIVMGAAKRLHDNGLPYRPWGQAHDELIYHVPEDEAEVVGALVAREMSAPPEWAPTLPLAAEYNTGDTYLDCK
jgi:hypothetical protein